MGLFGSKGDRAGVGRDSEAPGEGSEFAVGQSVAPTVSVPVAPKPRRLGRPSWLDPRLLLGLLLVVGCALVGATVLRNSQQTISVWKAERSLNAGTVIADGDLVPAQLHLADVAGAYLGADQPVVGLILDRPVGAGELLPVAALSTPTGEGRLVNVGVAAGNLPPGVAHGSRIDLYLVRGADAAGTKEITTQRIATEVMVQNVIAPSGGGLSGSGNSKYQVVLLLEPAAADELVKQLPTGSPLVVLATAGPR